MEWIDQSRNESTDNHLIEKIYLHLEISSKIINKLKSYVCTAWQQSVPSHDSLKGKWDPSIYIIATQIQMFTKATWLQ